MTYIGAVFLVQLTRDTSQTSKWGQTRLGCVGGDRNVIAESDNTVTDSPSTSIAVDCLEYLYRASTKSSSFTSLWYI